MIILGISVCSVVYSAIIVKDGKLISTVEEENLQEANTMMAFP